MQAKLLQNFLSEVEGRVKLKSHFIERFHDTYPVKAMCEAFEVSRRGYPFWRMFQKEMPRDQWLGDLIVECQQQCNPAYGIRRVRRWIQRQNEKSVKPKALLRVMQDQTACADSAVKNVSSAQEKHIQISQSVAACL